MHSGAFPFEDEGSRRLCGALPRPWRAPRLPFLAACPLAPSLLPFPSLLLLLLLLAPSILPLSLAARRLPPPPARPQPLFFPREQVSEGCHAVLRAVEAEALRGGRVHEYDEIALALTLRAFATARLRAPHLLAALASAAAPLARAGCLGPHEWANMAWSLAGPSPPRASSRSSRPPPSPHWGRAEMGKKKHAARKRSSSMRRRRRRWRGRWWTCSRPSPTPCCAPTADPTAEPAAGPGAAGRWRGR